MASPDLVLTATRHLFQLILAIPESIVLEKLYVKKLDKIKKESLVLKGRLEMVQSYLESAPPDVDVRDVNRAIVNCHEVIVEYTEIQKKLNEESKSKRMAKGIINKSLLEDDEKILPQLNEILHNLSKEREYLAVAFLNMKGDTRAIEDAQVLEQEELKQRQLKQAKKPVLASDFDWVKYWDRELELLSFVPDEGKELLEAFDKVDQTIQEMDSVGKDSNADDMDVDKLKETYIAAGLDVLEYFNAQGIASEIVENWVSLLPRELAKPENLRKEAQARVLVFIREQLVKAHLGISRYMADKNVAFGHLQLAHDLLLEAGNDLSAFYPMSEYLSDLKSFMETSKDPENFGVLSSDSAYIELIRSIEAKITQLEPWRILPPEDVDLYRYQFKIYGGGATTINQHVCRSLMKKCCPLMNQTEIDHAIKEIDRDNNSNITEWEFLAYIAHPQNSGKFEKPVKEQKPFHETISPWATIFWRANFQNKKAVPWLEFANAFKNALNHGVDYTQEEIEEGIETLKDEFDTDQNGIIEMEEYNNFNKGLDLFERFAELYHKEAKYQRHRTSEDINLRLQLATVKLLLRAIVDNVASFPSTFNPGTWKEQLANVDNFFTLGDLIKTLSQALKDGFKKSWSELSSHWFEFLDRVDSVTTALGLVILLDDQLESTVLTKRLSVTSFHTLKKVENNYGNFNQSAFIQYLKNPKIYVDFFTFSKQPAGKPTQVPKTGEQKTPTPLNKEGSVADKSRDIGGPPRSSSQSENFQNAIIHEFKQRTHKPAFVKDLNPNKVKKLFKEAVPHKTIEDTALVQYTYGFGSGKTGWVITPKGLYFKNNVVAKNTQNNGFLTWKKLAESALASETISKHNYLIVPTMEFKYAIEVPKSWENDSLMKNIQAIIKHPDFVLL